MSARPSPPPGLPRQRRGTTPQQRGRYPDYDVLAEVGHWDATTREVVLARVNRVPAIQFFDEAQATTLRAFLDVALAQDAEPRIPVLEMVDDALAHGRTDGFRHHDMPHDGDVWIGVAAHLDASARELGQDDFATAKGTIQLELVNLFARGALQWEDLPSWKAWSVVMRAALQAFYSHPWAWSEIGFGGPAYPRGFARMGAGQREHWERPPQFDVDPVRDTRERGL